MEVSPLTPIHKLTERQQELAEHLSAPYLTEQRRESIRRELGIIGFELISREQEKATTLG